MTPYSPVSSGVPNLSSIGPAVLEIWKRHPARAHVQLHPNRGTWKYILNDCNLLIGIKRYAKFEHNRSSRSRDLEASPCTCARAVAPLPRHMEMHRLESVYLHAKF